MIFEEVKSGCQIWIPHREMMCEDTDQFVSLILKGKAIYKRNNHADMDHDDSEEI